MKRYFKIILPILFLSVLGFLGYKIIQKINYKKTVAAHIKTIPNFSYQKINGGSFTQSSLQKDTPTLFIYFNSDCNYCNEEAQMIRESIDEFSSFQLVFVSFEQPKAIQAFAQKHQLLQYGNIHFVCDTKVTFATTFDVKSLPCLVLYDKNQQLIEKIKGQTKVPTLLKKLNQVN